MSSRRPESRTWVVSLHAAETDPTPIGAGTVIDDRRILTAAHIVAPGYELLPELWVAFPFSSTGDEDDRGIEDAEPYPRCRVEAIRLADGYAVGRAATDVTVLLLTEPVPTGVEPAQLRCPSPSHLRSRAWWAWGFPDGGGTGHDTDGTIGRERDAGEVRLDSLWGRRSVGGFGGAGLWCPNYGAVVGVVGRSPADEAGDGQAMTLDGAHALLPGARLLDLTAWRLSTEAPEEAACWALPPGHGPPRRRAPGPPVSGRGPAHFRGRRAALTAVRDWLDQPEPAHRLLVVTGAPGVGKSALLARLVATADERVAASLPAEDDAVRARVGSVSCAVHAGGKTSFEVAAQIARAASAAVPDDPEDLPENLLTALHTRGGARFTLVVDALDDAATPGEARAIRDTIVRPIAERCAAVGAQVVVGTRRADREGDLLTVLAPAATVVDLDADEYFAAADMVEYATDLLGQNGENGTASVYRDREVALPVARRIAESAGRSFLVAGLAASSRGLYDTRPATANELALGGDVESALTEYLERLSGVVHLPAADLLTALAHAEPPGWPLRLWQVAVEALTGERVPLDELLAFTRSTGARFLVGSTAPPARTGVGAPHDEGSTFALSHRALADTLTGRGGGRYFRSDSHGALTEAFVRFGRVAGWATAPPYLQRSLPHHAVLGGRLDDLLADDEYLLHADLRRLVPASDAAATPAGQERARLLRLTPQAVGAPAAERVARYSTTEALERLPAGYRTAATASPYRATWASAQPRLRRRTLRGHTDSVSSVCGVKVGEQQLLASTSQDGTVRLWNLDTGRQVRILEGHLGGVWGACAVKVGDRQFLATTGEDTTVRVWDPVTGEQVRVLEGHTRGVLGVCPLPAGDRQLLATTGKDTTVRVWDPATGEQLRVIEGDIDWDNGHSDWVNDVCAVSVGDRLLLATTSEDETVRLWDPATGEQVRVIEEHTSTTWGVCVVQVDDRPLLAAGSSDRTVRVWDPATGDEVAVLEGHTGWVNDVCVLPLGRRQLLASAGDDRRVRLWDPASGEQLRVLDGHTSQVDAGCAVTAGGDQLLASAGRDGTVQVWQLDSRGALAALGGHTDEVTDVCVVPVGRDLLLASTARDATIRLWHPATGTQVRAFHTPTDWVNGVCVVPVRGQNLLACAGSVSAVQLWDPVTGEQVRALEGHLGMVNGACAVPSGGRQLLATAGGDGTVRLWDPDTGEQVRVLEGHDSQVSDRSNGDVNAVCVVSVGRRQLLASAGADSTVRLWDPDTGERQHVLDGHSGPVNSACALPVGGQDRLATVGSDGTVQLWDPATGEQLRVLDGHVGPVNDACAVPSGGHHLLATAGSDGTIRLWDPHTDRVRLVIPVPHPVLAVTSIGEGDIALGLTAGVLVISLAPR